MSEKSLHALYAGPTQRSTRTGRGTATARFGELHDPLVEFILDSEVIVGCVAWITEPSILEALSDRPVALVVQKENWWKKTDGRGVRLAGRYTKLTGGLPASQFPVPLAARGGAVLPPIACAGHAGATMAPLMHHKFVVRCSRAKGKLVPLAVWTGSFNFSANANESFENALEVHDPTIAAAYLAEFATVASVSESMNWTRRAATPASKPPAKIKTKTKAAKRPVTRKRAVGKRRRSVPSRPGRAA
ncbi:MAG: hypothetical protein ACRCYU_02285 [Nocardioides sp.]